MAQIYKHTCPNGLVYVGQTKYTWQLRAGVNPSKSYYGRFVSAIKKHGWNNFSHEVLEEGSFTSEELNYKERFWIKHFQSENPLRGYNIVPGSMDQVVSLPSSLLDEVVSFYSIHSIREAMAEFSLSMGIVVQILNLRKVTRHSKSFYSEEKLSEMASSSFRNLSYICSFCGNSFVPNKSRQKTCSKSCSGSLGARRTKAKSKKVAERMIGNSNSKGNLGGKITAHKRWHEAREIVKKDCPFCPSI